MPRNATQGLETRKDAQGRVVAYRASVKIAGTGGRKKRGHWRANLAEARAEYFKLRASAEALAAEAAAHDFPTVAEALEAFLSGAEQGRPWARGGRPYAPKTLRGYRQDAALWVVPAVGHVPVDRLKRSQVQGLVDEVGLFRSGQRARNIATVLQALYRHLLPRHDELHDPTIGVELPSGSEPREVIATPDELDAMVAALEEVDRPAFGLAAYAGLRAGELKGLQVADVVMDLPVYTEGSDVQDSAHLVVRAGWDAVEGRRATKHRREGEYRIVPVFAQLVPLLEAQLASLGADVAPDYPFLPGKGAQGSRIGRGLPLDTDQLLVRARQAWGEIAPEGFRLHDARHSWASALVLAGIDVATLSEWVGHRQASTTLDRYVKPLRRRGVTAESVRAWLGV